MKEAEYQAMLADREAGTPGPWRSKAMGGDSVVLADQHEVYQFSRGYGAYPIAVPRRYLGDDDRVNVDHQAAGFSHVDARRVARVPELEAEVIRMRSALTKIANSNRDGKPNAGGPVMWGLCREIAWEVIKD